MKDTLYCPFMGGNPCMGRSCACAVREHRFYVWHCGMVGHIRNSFKVRVIDSDPEDRRRVNDD